MFNVISAPNACETAVEDKAGKVQADQNVRTVSKPFRQTYLQKFLIKCKHHFIKFMLAV